VPGGQVPSSPPRISSTGTITAPSGYTLASNTGGM